MPGEKLVSIMQKAAKQSTGSSVAGIVVGQVTSVSPLKIKVDKLELTKTFLTLSPMCTEFKCDLPNVGTVTMWRGLKKGDRVLMLRVNEGQQYYVLQRKEGLT